MPSKMSIFLSLDNVRRSVPFSLKSLLSFSTCSSTSNANSGITKGDGHCEFSRCLTITDWGLWHELLDEDIQAVSKEEIGVSISECGDF